MTEELSVKIGKDRKVVKMGPVATTLQFLATDYEPTGCCSFVAVPIPDVSKKKKRKQTVELD